MFTFMSINALVTFAQSIVPQRVQQIRSITLRELSCTNSNGEWVFYAPLVRGNPPSDNLLVVLSSLRNLRTLNFDYVLSDGDYLRYMEVRYFPFPQTFPTAFLHPCCMVEYKVK